MQIWSNIDLSKELSYTIRRVNRDPEIEKSKGMLNLEEVYISPPATNTICCIEKKTTLYSKLITIYVMPRSQQSKSSFQDDKQQRDSILQQA